MGACLATGNTCVIKPSAIDSMVTLKLAEIIGKLDTPAGRDQPDYRPRRQSVGEALAAHPGVGFISFTGSSETGKRIMSVASGTLKRTQMELGGKNPFIVLDDADIKRAAQRGVASSCNNSGNGVRLSGQILCARANLRRVYSANICRVCRKLKLAILGMNKPIWGP